MAAALVVIENPEECPLSFTDITPVAARTYLSDEAFFSMKGAKVFNICQSHRYQSIGYYVSLLAEARGHKPVPSITTIQDMKSVGIIRLASDELDALIQKEMANASEPKPSLHIYFGRTPDKAREALASRLFKFFPTPFLRADLSYSGQWQLQNVSPLAVKEIPAEDRAFVEVVASEFFAGRKLVIPKRTVPRYDIAILHDPDERFPPSNPRALRQFVKAADSLGIGTELITRDDARRLSEFDALFIRETTNVDHHTYRIARKAVAEGLVVIDDPVSILRCSNKVYLAELLGRHRIPVPRTLVIHAKNVDLASKGLDLPCILKQPDSSFSQGVIQVADRTRLAAEARRMLKKSELVIAQEYMPTPFDWRIGILDRRPLFACKYYMARRHWQIYGRDSAGRIVEGKAETLPVARAPKRVVNMALKAANLVGDGLYGVDLKQIDSRVVVIEINDNPNIDGGCEDEVLQEDLYLRIMEVFLRRIEAVKTGGAKTF